MKAKARGYVSPIGRCGKSLTWDRVEIERYKRQGSSRPRCSIGSLEAQNDASGVKVSTMPPPSGS